MRPGTADSCRSHKRAETLTSRIVRAPTSYRCNDRSRRQVAYRESEDGRGVS
jgi:hypothetical protein